MPDRLPSDLLARHLAGEATDAERAAVEAWAAESRSNRQELDQLEAAWRRQASPEWNVEDAWRRVAARLDQPGAHVPATRARPTARGWALAAGLALVLGAALVWRLARPAVTPAQVVATGAGERRAVDLADGTRILLAPNSELRVAEGYGDGLRRVDLSGEAWFTVEHDTRRPFRVHVAGTITEDLGTEFLVRQLGGDSGVRVALVSGSASLRRDADRLEDALTLAPREVARLAPGDAQARLEPGTAVEQLVAWHLGRLEFESAPVSAVAADLSRWFAVTVVVPDRGVAARTFTGTLRLDALDDALEVLRLSLGVAIQRRGDSVFLRPE